MDADIEAILFDFDHTLGIDHHLEERVLRGLTRRYCIAPLSDAQISDALARFRTGEVSLAEALSRAFAGCACGPDIVETYKAEVLALLPSVLEPLPGAKDILDALQRRGLVVAILSNGWRALQCAKAAGIGFNGPVIVSDEIGAWKPDRSAFEIAGNRLDVDLTRSVYVGDSPTADVAGSNNAGMISVWANFEGMTYPDGIAPPAYTIERLEDLTCLLALR